MIEAVIFDLGNVLLHFDHRIIEQRVFEHCPDAPASPAARASFWDLAGRFELGHVEPVEFLTQWQALIGGHLDHATLGELWNDIFWTNDGVVNIVAAMPAELQLVLLSNTNALHAEYARRKFPEVFRRFTAQVLSFEVGAVKPDPAMYDAALESAGSSAERSLYFDDVDTYVRAASRRGLHAYQYVSEKAVRDICALYEIPLEE